MRAYLTVMKGPAQGQVATAAEGSVVRVGRQEIADFSVPLDRTMSSLHFAILCDPDRCRLRDLNSTNGTYVNGVQGNLVQLLDGDIIRAGQSEFQVRLEGEIHTAVIDPLRYPQVPGSLANEDLESPEVLKVEASSPASTDEPTESVSHVTMAAVEDSQPHDNSSTQDSTRVIRLNVTFQDATGPRQIWMLAGQTVIVGRNQMADVTVVGDVAISGIHFSLECGAKKCTLRDLHSQNGTHLNGIDVPYATIYSEDTFVAGQTTFQVTIEGGPEAPDAQLRTWVFEDLVRRKAATFYAQEIGDRHHLVDAVGTEPSPTELLRRLARHRDVGIVLDTSRVTIEPWESRCQEQFSHEATKARVLHVAEMEPLVEGIHQIWGQDAMAVLFPKDGVEVDLSAIATSLGIYQQGRPPGSANLGKVGDWVLWLCDRPQLIASLLPDMEAVLVQHPDPARWRILCQTEFITQLNRLGYLPAQPPRLDSREPGQK